MVYNEWKTLLKWMIWGGFPPIFGHTHIELTPDVTFVLLKLEYQFHISLFEAIPLNTPTLSTLQNIKS